MRPIILIAGRTGGPLYPLLAISRGIGSENTRIIGIKNGLESSVARSRNMEINYLPEVKLSSLSFSSSSLFTILLAARELMCNLVLLLYSFLRSLMIVHKYKPRAILSSGSFLAVPVLYAAKLYSLVTKNKIIIIVHQQDPLPGLANKLTINLADIKTCVFKTTQKYKAFSENKIIPNPIDTSLYSNPVTNNSHLQSFIEQNRTKPVLMVFGGGSGAHTINMWVYKNQEKLTEYFRIIHLTGSLQNYQHSELFTNSVYRTGAFLDDMPYALTKSDVVLCRAGLSSITELLYLRKPAFIVPISKSHQVVNAREVDNFFYVLNEADTSTWCNQIVSNYPSYFSNINYPNSSKVRSSLDAYYKTINAKLDNIHP